MALRILSIDEVSSSKPTSKISISTMNPETYSNRPCPKGCSLSTGLLARRKPIRVTTAEPASEMLLNASAIMATEPAKSPIVSLPAKSKIFKKIPVKLAMDAYLPRCFGSVMGFTPAFLFGINPTLMVISASRVFAVCWDNINVLYAFGKYLSIENEKGVKMKKIVLQNLDKANRGML